MVCTKQDKLTTRCNDHYTPWRRTRMVGYDTRGLVCRLGEGLERQKVLKSGGFVADLLCKAVSS